MTSRIWCLLITVFGLQLAVSLCDKVTFCPDFTATFVGLVDQTVEDPLILIDDPEQTFFKETLGFRDDDIQHAFQDALKFFNETYGLDFSLSLHQMSKMSTLLEKQNYDHSGIVRISSTR